jgi:S-adenosylmethionine:tRNA ribosyltransferase-isomerase
MGDLVSEAIALSVEQIFKLIHVEGKSFFRVGEGVGAATVTSSRSFEDTALSYNRCVLVSDFDFELPPELIAQQPPGQRGESRMLAMSRQRGSLQDLWFTDLPELLRPGDVLVLNDSRVIPARLFGTCPGKVEVLLTEQLSEWEWRALTRPARRMNIGQQVTFATPEGKALLDATVTVRGEFGERQLRFTPVDDFFKRLEELGHVPLPPYIRRQDQALDRERYQTVFARRPGSVAAPTAGLHFTPEVLERIRARGVVVTHLTLHVGLGTFQPVRVAEVAEIRLHGERYSLPEETALEVNRALREGRRVVAAGTTAVRVLEHCASIDRLEAHSGTTSIFLSPGARFQVVSALLTNFHLPQSTLLMLVCAFAGRENTLAAYRHAVLAGYRFFSYGDCMFIG